MRLLLGIFIALTVACLTGLGATWLATGGELVPGGVKLGAWVAHPRSGTTSIDPYARAAIARSGELPLASGDGVSFVARHDDAGQPLDGRCDVVLRGETPPARYWTLTLYDPGGALVKNALGRFGFTSQEILRRSDGAFDIVVAPQGRPGNWLPSGGLAHYVLALRLYDTPVGVAGRGGRETRMPSLARGVCS